MPRPLRILCVASIFPPDIGGPATYLPRLAAALEQRGHRVCVLTLSGGGRDESFPFPVVRLPRQMWHPRRWVLTAVHIVRLARRADVLFVHGLALESVLANVLAHRPLVHKIVGDLVWERAVVQGWVTDDFETFQQRRYGPGLEALRALRSWWARRAVRVIVPSHYLRFWVARWGVLPERLVVIPNAVDLPVTLPPPSLALPGTVRVVSVGRLVPWKRVDGILRGAAGLPEVGVVVVGDGPERARLEALARDLGMHTRVVFAGVRGREETMALIAAGDIFVLNSTYEGLPHVLLEAMSLGRAVVATAAGGTGEALPPEAGVLLPPGDPQALYAALRRLVRAPDERALLGAAARRAAARFSFPAMVEATERVLVESADGCRRR